MPCILLVTEEDLTPELLLPQIEPAAILMLTAVNNRSRWPVSSAALAFAQGSVRSAAERIGQHYGMTANAAEPGQTWADAIRQTVDRTGVTTVVTPYAPVGPVADALAAALEQLASDGIEVVQVRDTYDELAWPHATRGFFALKQKIPEVLEALEQERMPRLI